MDGATLLTAMFLMMVVVRPRDVPLVARNTGRLVGFTVRAVKRGRNYLDETLQRSTATSAMSSSPTARAVRSSVESSISQFSSMTTSLRQEMGDVPLTPASFIRSRLRNAANQGDASASQRPTIITRQSQSVQSMGETHKAGLQSIVPPPAGGGAGIPTTGRVSTGSSFIARGIEEHALQQRQDSLLGRRKDNQPPPSTDS